MSKVGIENLKARDALEEILLYQIKCKNDLYFTDVMRLIKPHLKNLSRDF